MLMGLAFLFWKMLDLQHQHNNCTTIPYMRVDSTHWGSPSCEGLLCTCCDGVVQESNSFYFLWKMLDLQHQYNNYTTIPHMRVDPTYWGPPSCEGLLYSCCIGVVQESNPIFYFLNARHISIVVQLLCKSCANNIYLINSPYL
jgi:hypothetical protein